MQGNGASKQTQDLFILRLASSQMPPKRRGRRPVHRPTFVPDSATVTNTTSVSAASRLIVFLGTDSCGQLHRCLHHHSHTRASSGCSCRDRRLRPFPCPPPLNQFVRSVSPLRILPTYHKHPRTWDQHQAQLESAVALFPSLTSLHLHKVCQPLAAHLTVRTEHCTTGGGWQCAAYSFPASQDFE